MLIFMDSLWQDSSNSRVRYLFFFFFFRSGVEGWRYLTLAFDLVLAVLRTYPLVLCSRIIPDRVLGLCGVAGIKPGLSLCLAKVLPTVLLPSPQYDTLLSLSYILMLFSRNITDTHLLIKQSMRVIS